MENTYTHEEKNGGYFTVFSCLIFLVMASLIMVCLGGILLYQGKSKASLVQVGALEHLAANYDKELWNRYGLLFLDPRMEAHLEEKTKEYYNTCFRETKEKTISYSLLDLRLEEMDVQTFGTMQEQQFRYFTTQIKKLIQYEGTKDAVLGLLQKEAEETKEQIGKVDDLKTTLEEKDAAIQELPEKGAEVVPEISDSADLAEAAQTAQTRNPVKTLASILKGGLFSYVTQEKKISKNQISPSNLPSGVKKEAKLKIGGMSFSELSDFRKLMESQEVGNGIGKISEKGMLAFYLKKYFNYYERKDPLEDTALQYEIEYIMGGNLTDDENLEYVVNRLILLRFCCNALYAFQDTELGSEAMTLATAIVGFTGTAPLIEGAKYTILSAVSLLEAIEDTKRLLDGENISLLKDQSSFRWSVTGKKEKPAEMGGFDYEKYLMILFLLSGNQKEQMLRMQDMMQVNIEKTEPGFLIHNVRAGICLSTKVSQRVPFIPGSYEFQIENQYTY